MIRKYISQEDFNALDGQLSSTVDYIIIDKNEPKKFIFMTNNLTGEIGTHNVEDEYPTPTGSLSILNNGTYDVKQYEYVDVDAGIIPTGTINIDADGTYDVTEYAIAEVNVPDPIPPVPELKTCSFTMLESGTFKITVYGVGSVYYKINNGDWTEFLKNGESASTSTVCSISVNTDDVVYVKSNVFQMSSQSGTSTPPGTTISFKNNTIKFKASGDIIGCVAGTYDIQYITLRDLFLNSTGLIEIQSDIFSGYNELPESFCRGMFYGCTSLTTAPALPATTLAPWCYEGMFWLCTSLTTPPELPATTLAAYCYQNMFNGCTSLTTAPSLSATTLAEHCCDNMFKGCTSLTTIPSILPATTLAPYCYANMFNGCTSLTTVPELRATTLADWCYNNMFQSCTSLTVTPELPATTLAEGCYCGIFADCTSLTTAPELPAPTLVDKCYMYMFMRSSALNYIKCLATDISATDCTTDWVKDVSVTGTFVKARNMLGWTIGTSGIRSGWTIEDAV